MFHKSVAILLSGTAFSQLIGIAVLPILTRLYSTEEMGVLAIFTAIVTILLTLVCLRLESAIPIQKNQKDAKSVMYLCVELATLISILVFIVCFVIHIYFNRITKGIDGFILYVPIAMFVGGLYITINAYALKREKFDFVSKSRMIQALSCAVIQVTGALIYQSAIWLVIGFIFNLGAGIGYLKRKLKLRRIFVFSRLTEKRNAFARNANFPKFSVVESLSNAAGVQAPILLIAYGMSVSEAAFLFLAMKLIQAPMALLGSSISQVYYSQATSKILTGELPDFTAKVLKTAMKIGVGPIIAMSILAPITTEKILGAEWSSVGYYIFLMSPWFVIQFIASPISPIMYIMSKQKEFMYLTLFGLVWKLGLTSIAVLYNSYVVEVLVFANITFYLICFFFFTKTAGISIHTILRIFFSSSLSILLWVIFANLGLFTLEFWVRND